MVRGSKRVILIKRFNLINKDLIGEQISNLANRLTSLIEKLGLTLRVSASPEQGNVCRFPWKPDAKLIPVSYNSWLIRPSLRTALPSE